MIEQYAQLRKMQLQALLVSVQSFVDQFSIKKIDEVHAYIELKNPILFPEKIKQLAKTEFDTLFQDVSKSNL